MKYVVTVIDDDTGKIVRGDIPTSKAWASRWAKENARLFGGIWGIALADDCAMDAAIGA